VIPSNRSPQERPSHKELAKKIRECRRLVDSDRWLPANLAKLRADFDELEAVLGLETTLQEDQKRILLAAIGEITPAHYAGLRPPQRSYEPAIRDRELLAFRWTSTFFAGHEMYFKFCLKGADKDQRAYICSVHEHRENQDD